MLSAGSGERRRFVSAQRESMMQILLVAFCAIASIWIIVLWGSRYLGPR